MPEFQYRSLISKTLVGFALFNLVFSQAKPNLQSESGPIGPGPQETTPPPPSNPDDNIEGCK
jgi:hypothetical protein